MRGHVNTPDVLTVKDRIGVEGPDWMCTAYKMLKSKSESFIVRAKSRRAAKMTGSLSLRRARARSQSA